MTQSKLIYGMFALLYVCSVSAGFAEDQLTLSKQMRSAIVKAIPTLEAGTIGSANERQCFTCHSQALPVFTLKEAKNRGFAIDSENLRRQLKHTHEHLKRGLDGYREAKGQGGGALTAGYAMWTLEVGEWPADEVTEAVNHYLLELQKDLKHWRHRGTRPPTSGSDFTVTYVALRSLNHFGTETQRVQIDVRRKEVAQWIFSKPADETEDMVFRLSSLRYLDIEPKQIEQAVSALKAKQRDNGGWGQMDDMASDAYATGSALVALMEEGHVSKTDPAIEKGIEYLLKTQAADGTWHVATRAKPVQEYFVSGFPYEKDQFISISATAWSTLALIVALPSNGGVNH